MRLTSVLRRLDQRLLPPLSRVLRRVGYRPGLRQVTVAGAVLGTAAVLVAAVLAAREAPGGSGTAGVARVGVVEGESIPEYASHTREELRALAAAPRQEETYALVALAAYLAPDRLAATLAGVASVRAYARVPLRDTNTELVQIDATRLPDDLVAGMLKVAERKEDQAREAAGLAAGLTGDSPVERAQRERYQDRARVALAEATAYREGCSCLYAAVVRAVPAELVRLSERPEVRIVDAAPEVRQLSRAVFLPPLPEQSGVVLPPAAGTGTPPAAPTGSPAAPTGSPSLSGTPNAAPTADPSTPPVEPTTPDASPSPAEAPLSGELLP